MKPDELFHFSEDPSIETFVPHVPATNPTHPPAVWTIDADHAPLYWFPRNCPRVTVWPRTPTERSNFEQVFKTTAHRLHGIEHGWLHTVRTTTLYRYTFDATPFEPWAEASGQWITAATIMPTAVEPVGNLMQAHADAGIELRLAATLWPLHDLAVSDAWDFSIVRMRNAQPRPLVVGAGGEDVEECVSE